MIEKHPFGVPSLGGVIFDFDGVLVDTEEPQIQAWIQTIENLGAVPNEKRIRLLSGNTDENIAQCLFGENSAVVREAVRLKKSLVSLMAPDPVPRRGADEVLGLESPAASPIAKEPTSRQTDPRAELATALEELSEDELADRLAEKLASMKSGNGRT